MDFDERKDICDISHYFGGGVDKYEKDLISLNKQYNVLIVKKHWEKYYKYEYYKNGEIIKYTNNNILLSDVISSYTILHINSLLPYPIQDIKTILEVKSYKILTIHDLGLLCLFQHDPLKKIDENKLKIYNIIADNVNKIICVSKFVYNLFKNNTESKNNYKLCVINNPDIDIYSSSSNQLTYFVDKNIFRVCCIGSLNEYKGLNILHEVQQLSKNNNSSLDFLIIGDCPFNPKTGIYNEDTFIKFVKQYKPHLLWFPTICDETYSYTYSLALALNIPIFSSYKGAFIERSTLSDIAYTYKIIDSKEWYKILIEAHKYYIKENYCYKLKEIDFTIKFNEINNIYKEILIDTHKIII